MDNIYKIKTSTFRRINLFFKFFSGINFRWFIRHDGKTRPNQLYARVKDLWFLIFETINFHSRVFCNFFFFYYLNLSVILCWFVWCHEINGKIGWILR